MAPRYFWKGYLKLSLVTCPVAMTPAVTAAEKIRFRTLNRATGHPVVSRYVDAETGDVVESDEQIAGYQVGENRYVQLEDEELDEVALDSTHTLEIEQFVARDTVETLWLDQAYYVTPDDPVGIEAFSVIREAMASTGTVGVSKVVLYRRERALLLQPRGLGLLAWTLRYGDEVRDPKDYFGQLDGETPPAELLKVARAVIAERTRPWSDELVQDRVQKNLQKVIAAKQKGRKPPKAKPEPEPRGAKVINIMDALKRSLEQERKGKRRS